MKIKVFIFLFSMTVLAGCSFTTEVAKKVIGNSTEALEEARDEQFLRNYDCDFDECFNVILALDRKDEYSEPKTEKAFSVFMEDRIKGFIVVMGVDGNVDTTEVGIFFSYYGKTSTTIDISSLASSAKRRVAEAVFEELDLNFNEIE